MKRQTGHPDVEALANFRAGLVGGIHGRRITAHIARCERCAQLSDQLSAVTWTLASVPVPSLPEAVEQRIGAAIAAEATTRRVAPLAASSMADPSAASMADPSAAASPVPASPVPASPVPASPAPASPAPASLAAAERQPARRWSLRRALGSARPRLRLSPVQMLVPVTACLLLAGLGYLLSVPGTSSVPSSAGPASAQSAKGSMSSGPRRAISPPNAIGPTAGSHSTAFLVTVSTIRYQKSTLRALVKSQLARQALTPNVSLVPAITGTPGNQEGTGSGASQSNSVIVPPGSLVGCVMHLTRGVRPMLVQKATYQAKPAYVIAVQDQVWVVHLSCNAAKPALITSVVLAPAG